MVDTVLIMLGALFIVIGIIGSIVPVLPGPPVSYIGLILLQLTSKQPFSIRFLILFGVLTVFVFVIDYVIPVYGTKKLQGSKYGIWGSAIGLIIGVLFFFPLGIIVGPIIGAFLGELVTGKNIARSLKSAFGSLVGFLAGTAMKLVLSISMAYYYILNIL
jgi:uncharacterized protein YqgC (DUF456 family)